VGKKTKQQMEEQMEQMGQMKNELLF